MMDEPQYIPPKSSSNPNPVAIGCISLVVCTLLAVFWATMQMAQNMARSNSCFTNVKKLGEGIRMYVTDYDDTLPLTANWYDIAAKNSASKSLRCPSVKDGIGYALDSRIAGKKASKLGMPDSNRILFYESSDLTRNASDPGTNFTVRHGSYGSPVLFVDGHTRLLKEEGGASIVRSGKQPG